MIRDQVVRTKDLDSSRKSTAGGDSNLNNHEIKQQHYKGTKLSSPHQHRVPDKHIKHTQDIRQY